MHLRIQQHDLRSTPRGFSLPELLIVIGIISLLIAMMLPPLQMAHRRAKQTRCAAQLRELGISLEMSKRDYRYYPIWDDQGAPVRYTWIDILLQRHLLNTSRVGYCPDDGHPGDLNRARGSFFQVHMRHKLDAFGIDYSYGIGVPLAAGGWNWSVGWNDHGDTSIRRFENPEYRSAGRVLAADAGWSYVYNLSGDALSGHDWSYPSQYDNTVDWRHPDHGANAVMQDGHVETINYRLRQSGEPVNTSKTFVWQPAEPVHAGPDTHMGGMYYPNVPPARLDTGESAVFPSELIPGYYTHTNTWTLYLE
jgi:prepilin-type N-terminal cleavage/methylation domain-containing protein/prepilin-type processing-associated H-X9-DG protein